MSYVKVENSSLFPEKFLSPENISVSPLKLPQAQDPGTQFQLVNLGGIYM